MTRPTHVFVGRPIDCKTCNGTGIVEHGFAIGPRGPICQTCAGAKLTREAITLEEFAALFTYGRTHHYRETDVAGVPECVGVTDDILVRSERQGGDT